jgi:hypothetical protein
MPRELQLREIAQKVCRDQDAPGMQLVSSIEVSSKHYKIIMGVIKRGKRRSAKKRSGSVNNCQ